MNNLIVKLIFVFILFFGVITEAEQEQKLELVVQTGHTDSVSAVALSPDGKLLASGDSSLLKLWDVATGKELRTWNNVGLGYFSSDSRFLVSGRSLIDVSTGQVNKFSSFNNSYGALNEEKAIFTTVSYSAGFVEVWSLKTKERLHYFRGRSPIVFSKGKLLAVFGEYEKIGKQQEEKYKEFYNNTNNVPLIPEGKDRLIHIIELETGKEVQTLGSFLNEPLEIRFSGDGKRLFTFEETSIKVWDVANGRLIKTLKGNFGSKRYGYSSRGTDFYPSPDGNSVLIETLKPKIHEVKLWNIDSDKLINLRAIEHDHIDGSEVGIKFNFTADGRTLAIPEANITQENSENENAKIYVTFWNTENGQIIKTLDVGTYPIRTRSSHPVFSSDGLFLVINLNNKIELWNLKTEQKEKTFEGYSNPISKVSIGKGGKTLVINGSDSSAIWSLDKMQAPKIIAGHQESHRDDFKDYYGKYFVAYDENRKHNLSV